MRASGTKLGVLWRNFRDGTTARAIARMLVCLYFVNLVVEDFYNWNLFRTSAMRKARLAQYGQKAGETCTS